jgi:hypothetical protein
MMTYLRAGEHAAQSEVSPTRGQGRAPPARSSGHAQGRGAQRFAVPSPLAGPQLAGSHHEAADDAVRDVVRESHAQHRHLSGTSHGEGRGGARGRRAYRTP